MRGSSQSVTHADAGSVIGVAFGRHFTAAELAEIWRLDETTIRRMFQDVPGVLKIGKSQRRDGKRDYMTLRIPEGVALRVYQQRSKGTRL
ncbi:MAG: hypothetical protein LAP61_24950 [Acidobacteriia bacterium]|nr:hypothetical protein [Terriglobia bacterium]